MFYKHCKADLIHCLSAIALAYESHIGGNVCVNCSHNWPGFGYLVGIRVKKTKVN
jgi:ABC-type dipeptide/oligopeptide/nickel transport system permease component